MNTRPPAPDPLDPNELEFARILRALPGGEPSPALDARILGAARDAVEAPAPPPRRYGLWTATSGGAIWGIGSAAAAILAVGIVWRVNAPQDNLPPPPRLQRTAVEASEHESTAVDFVEAPGEMVADAGPPPPPMQSADAQVPSAAPARAVAAKPAAPPPAPQVAAAPATELPEAFSDKGAGFEMRRQRQDQGNEIGATSGLASASAPAPPAPAAAAEARPTMDAREYYLTRRAEEAKAAARAEGTMKQQAEQAAPSDAETEKLDAVTVTGSRLRDEDDASTRARALEDAELTPDQWLAKVRLRLREGDVDGARASLRLYTERYPQRTVPEDLRPLLRQ